MFGKAPQGVAVQGNVQRHWPEMVIRLGPDKCQSGELLLDLGKLPGRTSNEDRLQRCKEGIRTRKYLGKKLLPSHKTHYNSFPGRINVEKTSEQCF